MKTSLSEPAHNPFLPRPSTTRRVELVVRWGLRGLTYFILLCISTILLTIAIKGSQAVFQAEWPYINMEFLTQAPETLHVFEADGKTHELSDSQFRATYEANGLTPPPDRTYAHAGGGIFPAIIGTLLLVAGAMTIAMLLGIASAIFLSEYGSSGPLLRLIRLSILNLAGVPSIVYGLFGFGLFVIFLDWNISLLAGWFTLAFMVLPVIISASEDALRSVPTGFREASLALGATRWTMIRTSVLPYALPGILTSSVLGIARVAGETAPIMFTAAYLLRDQLPWEGLDHWYDFFFQGVMALPYHLYVVSAKLPQNAYTERMQYGTAFVFLIIVAVMALTSILLRIKIRSRHNW
ncbi:MAG: phosphate ABC transporter permease PstA [Puniceicoccales bacterium]